MCGYKTLVDFYRDIYKIDILKDVLHKLDLLQCPGICKIIILNMKKMTDNLSDTGTLKNTFVYMASVKLKNTLNTFLNHNTYIVITVCSIIICLFVKLFG